MIIRPSSAPHRAPSSARARGLAVALVAACLLPAPALAQSEDGTATSTVPLRLVKPPKLVELVPADVPPGTEFPSPQVVVTLRIEVGADGMVGEVAVVEGVGEPFDSAARAAAEAFVFEPGVLNDGRTVPVTVTFRLTIEQPPPPPPPPEAPPPLVYEGTLLERGTRRPIPDVLVEARLDDGSTLTSTLTDARGVFRLSVEATRFELFADPITHEPLRAPVAGEAGESIKETIYLQARGSPYEVVVRGRAVRREVVERTISKKEVLRSAGTTGDAIKAVVNLPGVARAAFDGGAIVLRGAAPGDSGTFLEQQEIPQIYHFGGLRSTFNSAFLEELSFIPGNFGPEYGRFVGGVIDVRVRDPAEDTFRAAADINLYDASIVLEGPVSDEVSIGGAFRRSYIDAILPAVIPEDASVGFNTAPRFYDYQVLATWRPSKEHKLRAIWYGSLDRLELLFDDPQTDPAVRGTLSTRVMFHNLLLSSTWEISKKLRQTISVQGGLQEISFAIGPEFKFDLSTQQLSMRGTWDLKASDWLGLRAGIDARQTFAQLSLNAPQPPKEGERPPPLSTVDTFDLDIVANNFDPGLFLEARFTPLDKALLVVPSLRTDYYQQIGRFTVDPRLLVEYRPLDDTSLRGGVGVYQQQPQPDESADAQGIGNPNLLPERSVQASLGVQQRLVDVLSLELTGFYKWLDNLVVRNPAFFSDPTQVPYDNEGVGRIFGLELLLRARIEPDFFGWVAYTFQRSYRTDRPGQDERLFDFDQPHILTMVGSYELGAGWSVGARFRLVSGNPSTPVTGSLYDVATDVFVPLYGPVNSERLGTFHQLDIRVDKVWTFETWKLNFYVDVQNVYNRQNPEGQQFNFDFSRQQTIGGLPILPILGIKGEY
jgi:TonB family protein